MSPAEMDSIHDLFNLDEVVVTAQTSFSHDIVAPQKIDTAQLARMSTLSVADAIRYMAGVQLKDYGGVGGVKTINIRSMGSQHVGVFYNGIQLGNAQNGQIDLGRFSLDNIMEISLTHGIKSNLLQSAKEVACAGNIYLVTRRPRFQTGERVHARVGMKAGSFGLANPSFGVDVNLSEGKALYLTLDAEYLYSKGNYPFRYKRVTPSGEVAYDTTAVRHNGDVQAVRAELGLHHYYSADGFWRLHAYNYVSERGIPGAIVNNVWSNGERLKDENHFVQVEWQDNFFRWWHPRVSAKYAYDYTHYCNLDERLLPADNEYTQQQGYLSMVNGFDICKIWKMSLAYDMEYNHLSKQERAVGGPLEHYSRWSHYLSLTNTLEYKQYIRVQASVLYAHIDHTDRVTPTVVVSSQPIKKVDLFLNIWYKQSYRYPTFNDLYYTDMGNAELRPELARQRNVGVSYGLPFSIPKATVQSRWDIQADYYCNKVTDKIIAYPKGQQFRWTMLNLGVVQIHGVDLSTCLNLALPYRWNLVARLQYTYQNARDVTNERDSYYGHQIPYIPAHSGSATLDMMWKSKRGDEYGLNYSFIYAGERWSQQENIIYNHVQPWYTHDMTLYGEWGVRHHRLRAQVEVNNLLGQDYEVIQNYPMPKQTIRCSIRVSY